MALMRGLSLPFEGGYMIYSLVKAIYYVPTTNGSPGMLKFANL